MGLRLLAAGLATTLVFVLARFAGAGFFTGAALLAARSGALAAGRGDALAPVVAG